MNDPVLDAAASSVAAMIGASFSGTAAEEKPESATATFEEGGFDGDFQSKIAAFVCRDDQFMRRVSHLIKPEYFENAGEAALVNIAVRHYEKYRSVPDNTTMAHLIRDDVVAKIIRKDMIESVKEARKRILIGELRNREFVEDKVVEFAKHQAVSQAILKSVDLLGKGKFTQIEQAVQAAISVGANDEGVAYDYFERIAERTATRLDKAAGIRPPQGITTGTPKLDELLYHRGWGRKELSSIMGLAKMGKTTALVNFAKDASLAGYNVLYASLEVGADIVSDRIDASISSTMMRELCDKIHGVREKVEEASAKAGALKIHEFPSGTLTPNQLRKLIDRYKSPGWNSNGTTRPPIKFDLIVVDYADIMAPNHRTNDAIENSKSVYVDLRAIAFEENAAVLTATQTNREAAKTAVAKMEHVSEDFNKIRTVDLMISINKTEEEAARGEARLYFAASRNQESGFSVVIKQDISCMQFITSVLRVE